MKQYQMLFDNEKSFSEKLNNMKKEFDSFAHGDMTFYITWMNDAKEDADLAFEIVGRIFPNVICYGNESSGNIHVGSIAYGVNVTCYLFEKESSKAELVWVQEGTDIQSLDDLWAYCRTKENLCAVEMISSLAYLDVLKIDRNVPDLDENIQVFGGVSCNYFNPEMFSGILATGHPRTTSGMAVILYSGHDISFVTTTVLGWKSLGQKMKVTASENDCIIEINNTPAFHIYEHYLGLSVDDSDSFVFPLMVTEGQYDFIRTPRIINPDKSLVMFANIPVGTTCSLAYGNKNTILSSISDKAKNIAQLNPQVIKAFSCGGRRLFWGDNEISKETIPLQKIAPVSGFYTGGEIVRIENQLRVLNQTLAITSISESKSSNSKATVIFNETDKSLVARLAYFTEVVAAEQVEEQRKLLHDMEIISGLASQYRTLFLVNLDTGLYVNYGNSDSSSEINNVFSSRDLLDFASSNNWVHPDSMDDFVNFFSNEKDKIRYKKTASLIFKCRYADEYLWTKALLVKCESIGEEPHHAVLGFIECDNEVRRDEAIHKFTDVLEQGHNPEASINNILYSMADYYQADKTYVMEFYNKGKNLLCTYSWNIDEIDTMKNSRYEIPQEELAEWINEFNANGYILVETSDTGYEKLRNYFKSNNVTSSILVPLKQNNVIIGLVGVSNPKKSIHDAGIGKVASAVINSEIMRRKENDEEHITLGKLSDSFVSVYYANLDSDYIRAWKLSEEKNAVYLDDGSYSKVIDMYIGTFAAESEKEQLFELTSPEYVINQFRTTDQYSFEVTANLGGKETNLIFDFIRVSDDGKQLVISCRDVTEITERQREHRRQLQEALDMAKSADKAKTEFLFNMSHDIRTPMNAILGFTDIAMRHFNDKERAMDSLLKIKSSSKHLLHLINDILEMSRIESGKFELEESPIDIREAIKSVEHMTRALATPKSIDYQVISGEIKNPYIYADELHVNEIIVNLISNAIKYTNEDGKVRYFIDQLGDVTDGKVMFRFEVLDNGIGMSEEFQKHLFEAFSREKTSTVSKQEGAGLGLSIVKRIVMLAGGNISVKSKLGEGSSFVVELPFRVMEQEAIDKLVPEHKQNNEIKEDVVLDGKRVLLVEDNEMNREIADEILTEAGLIVEAAENGKIAVDMVTDKGINYYDFILMDIQMPVLDGYGATGAIRSLPNGKDITIIALSANAFEEDKQKSISMGMNAHVAKPIDVKDLFRVMHELA